MSRIETLEQVVKAIEYALDNIGKESPSVRHEALAALAKLVIQCPVIVRVSSTVKILIVLLARYMLDDVDRVREKANVVLTLTLNHLQDSTTGLLHIPETISDALSHEITTNLLSQLNDKLSEGKELIVIRAWGYFVALLARSIIKNGLINPLLKIPSSTFKSTNSDVRSETFHSWKYLIDNFTQQPNSIVVPKRLTLLITPFVACLPTEKNTNVLITAFRSWIYLLQCLGLQITESHVWDTAVAPCVELFAKLDHTSDPKSEIKLALLKLLVHLIRCKQPNTQLQDSKNESSYSFSPPFSLKSFPVITSLSREFWFLRLKSWLEWFHLFLTDSELFKNQEKETPQLLTELWRCTLFQLNTSAFSSNGTFCS
jgi:hypothetical protein